MPETNTAAPATTSNIASNITKAINAKANGKAPAATPPSPINDGQQPPATPPDPNAGKEKYVVDGREVWVTPEERATWIQKGMAFEPRMDQLARLTQEQQQLTKALLNDPGRVLQNLAKQSNVPMKDLVQRVLQGNSSDEIKEAVGQWYYENAVEPLKMTPEQLKAREDAKYRKQREEQDKSDQEMSVRRENQAKFQKALGEIKANIDEAMKESGLPNNDTPLGAEMARMVADVMRVAHFKREAVTPKQAIEFVKRRIKSVQAAYYDHLDGEALVKELGEANAEKVKKHFLKLVQENGSKPPVVPNGKRPAARHERETVSFDDFHEYLDKRKKEG